MEAGQGAQAGAQDRSRKAGTGKGETFDGRTAGAQPAAARPAARRARCALTAQRRHQANPPPRPGDTNPRPGACRGPRLVPTGQHAWQGCLPPSSPRGGCRRPLWPGSPSTPQSRAKRQAARTGSERRQRAGQAGSVQARQAAQAGRQSGRQAGRGAERRADSGAKLAAELVQGCSLAASVKGQPVYNGGDKTRYVQGAISFIAWGVGGVVSALLWGGCRECCGSGAALLVQRQVQRPFTLPLPANNNKAGSSGVLMMMGRRPAPPNTLFSASRAAHTGTVPKTHRCH